MITSTGRELEYRVFVSFNENTNDIILHLPIPIHDDDGVKRVMYGSEHGGDNDAPLCASHGAFALFQSNCYNQSSVREKEQAS